MSGYLLFKSLHLIAVISWMAGLLYLPRIFVYHVENFEKDQATEIFETMERKLYNYIMRPAMILSWLFGIILIWINGIESFAYLWLQLKILSVVILFGTFLGAVWFAAKIYRVGILMYGKKPTYKELFKWLKY